MQKNNFFKVAIHLTCWLFFLSFPFIFFSRSVESTRIFSLASNRFYWQFCICYILIFYCNSLYLVPAFFLKGKHFGYFTLVLILLVGVCLLQPFDRLISTLPAPSESGARNKPLSKPEREEPPPPEPEDFGFNHPPRPEGRGQPMPYVNTPGHLGPPQGPGRNHMDTTSLFLFIIVITLSTAVELSAKWQLTEQRATQAEAEKVNAELSFLKAQINPHFLFNTLNNIYSLAVTRSEYTAESIMKLSNIMRYITDEVSEDFVALQKELDCIEDYIGLQQLRAGKKTHIDFSISGNPENKRIAPLLLMTFVENVFKHGISKQEDCILLIRISQEANGISLFCQNPLFETQTSKTREGIGIANTRQRLEHLYPGRHQLNLNTENGFYTVKLNLYS